MWTTQRKLLAAILLISHGKVWAYQYAPTSSNKRVPNQQLGELGVLLAGFCLALESDCPKALLLPDNTAAGDTLLKGCSMNQQRAYLCRRFARRATTLIAAKPVRVAHCPGTHQFADHLSRSDLIYPALTWVASVPIVPLEQFWSS